MLKRLLFAALMLCALGAQAAVYSLPWGPKPQFVDANGAPMSGGSLLTYLGGSTTPQVTYTDSTGGTSNPTTITLNTRGETPNEVWLTGGVTYKFVLNDSSGSTIWTVDGVTGVNDTTGSQSEWVAGPTPTYVSATSFTLAGDQTSTFSIGRRIRTTNSGGTVYSTISNSVFGASTTVTVINDASNLDSGLSAVSYGLLAANNPSMPVGAQQQNDNCNGRLTLTTATPVTTADVTAATTLYWTPYKGNTCALYDGTKWTTWKFAEISIAVPNTTVTMYDVWLYNNSGVLALEVLAWTNDTTRATAVALQDGVYVKSGATTRRYLGSFRTTGVAGQTEDSAAKRFVWNNYNRVTKTMSHATESTVSWNYTTATWRQANANAANQLDYVVGLNEDMVEATVLVSYQSTGANQASVGVGVDVTNANSTQIRTITVSAAGAGRTQVLAFYKGTPGVGRHFLAWVEFAQAAGTNTFFGQDTYGQSGMVGSGRF